MASEDGTYYDRLIRTIEAMANVHDADSLVQLYKEQCKQMIRDFMHVRDVLGERKHVRDVLDVRKDSKTDGKYSSILKEFYRQTLAANAVLESCCCEVEVKQDDKTVRYSLLQVAATQSDEMIFKFLRDDLNWCLELVSKVGDSSETTEEEPRSYSYSTKLADIDRGLIDKDKSDLERRLAEAENGSAQESDRKLAMFLKERLNNDEKHVFFANKCVSDLRGWSRSLSDCNLGPCVMAVDWLGVKVARKVFMNHEADGDKPTPFSVEREIMASLNHPNVARFITCSDRGGDPAILMECVETTLHKYLEQRAEEYKAQRSGMLQDGRVSFSSGLNILEVVEIMYQIAFVMAYLHGNGVAHCDIKPSNLLVNPCKVPGFDGYVQLKIADFGVSKAGLNEDSLRDSSKKSRGTTIYRAPELQGLAKNVDLKKADVFSYALTCWHILHGKAPFNGMSQRKLHLDLLSGTRPVIDSSMTVPFTLVELIQKCWDTNPQGRPTFSDICMELQRYKEELLLGVVPSKLISVPEIKTRRRWKVFQSAYKSVKILAMQILPSHCFRSAKQDEVFVFPGDIISDCNGKSDEDQTMFLAPSYSLFRQSRVRGCFSRPKSSEDFPEFSGEANANWQNSALDTTQTPCETNLLVMNMPKISTNIGAFIISDVHQHWPRFHELSESGAAMFTTFWSNMLEHV